MGSAEARSRVIMVIFLRARTNVVVDGNGVDRRSIAKLIPRACGSSHANGHGPRGTGSLGLFHGFSANTAGGLVVLESIFQASTMEHVRATEFDDRCVFLVVVIIFVHQRALANGTNSYAWVFVAGVHGFDAVAFQQRKTGFAESIGCVVRNGDQRHFDILNL